MGLLDYFLDGLIMYAAKKDIQNDPEIKKFVDKYHEDLKKITADYEETCRKIALGPQSEKYKEKARRIKAGDY